jgi:hypothetical protein
MLNVQEYRNRIEEMSKNIKELRASLWHRKLEWKNY